LFARDPEQAAAVRCAAKSKHRDTLGRRPACAWATRESFDVIVTAGSIGLEHDTPT
jgi:hypothetical protein